MKIINMVLVLALTVSILSGCGKKEIDEKALYNSFLKENFKKSDEIRFAFKDLDSDGKTELITHKYGRLTVYTIDEEKESVEKSGEHKYEGGSYRFLYSDKKEYPGIFTFSVGGGQNHYGYISLKGGKLTHKSVRKENYSGLEGVPPIENISKDTALSEESAYTYFSKNDIIFKAYGKSYDKKLFDVLNSKSEFTDASGVTGLLKDSKTVIKNMQYEFIPDSYLLIDLNRDGVNELVIKDKAESYNLILYYDEKAKLVRGYSLGIRSFNLLKPDGSFMGSGGAGYNTISRVETFFDNWIQTKDCAVYNVGKDYELDTSPTDEATVKKFFDIWNEKKSAEWIKIK